MHIGDDSLTLTLALTLTLTVNLDLLNPKSTQCRLLGEDGA